MTIDGTTTYAPGLGVIDGTRSRDPGNTGFTTTLRPGLLLAKNATTKKYATWSIGQSTAALAGAGADVTDVAAAEASPTAAAAVEEAFFARRGAVGCSARLERGKARNRPLGVVPRQSYGRDAVDRDVGHDREPPLRLKMRQRRGCQRHAPAGLGQAAEHHQVHGHRHGRPARVLGRVGQ